MAEIVFNRGSHQRAHVRQQGVTGHIFLRLFNFPGMDTIEIGRGQPVGDLARVVP